MRWYGEGGLGAPKARGAPCKPRISFGAILLVCPTSRAYFRLAHGLISILGTLIVISSFVR